MAGWVVAAGIQVFCFCQLKNSARCGGKIYGKNTYIAFETREACIP